jgi:hypothetical protein
MFGKKYTLNQCQKLQNQIKDLQRQIDELRSEQFTVGIVDSDGEPVMIPEGYFASDPPGYGYFNHKPYVKVQSITLKEVVEAIIDNLGIEIKVLAQTSPKVLVRKK